jgi:multidrug transporter EmrE-like cation transporter
MDSVMSIAGNMKSVLLVLVPIAIGVAGQLFLKQGMMQIGHFAITPGSLFSTLGRVFLNVCVLFGLFLYAFSAMLWLIVLSRMDLSFAYPMLSVGYVAVLLFSWLVFHEPVSVIRWLGVFVICGGVFLISRS